MSPMPLITLALSATFSIITCPVADALSDNFPSIFGVERPFDSLSTMKPLITFSSSEVKFRPSYLSICQKQDEIYSSQMEKLIKEVNILNNQSFLTPKIVQYCYSCIFA